MTFSCYINAQQKIQGSIISDDGNTLSFANVLLQAAKDSTLVKGAISNENGKYLFEDIAVGHYIITASMVGFTSKSIDPFQLTDNAIYNIPIITLTAGLELDEVVVKSTKPLYVQKIDRTVINVSSSIVSAGTSALEVLERSPGVLVDRQNNTLSLSGKNGVVVMMDGKISYLPQSSLVQLLAGMSSDNIETIELITTPPANFDAEGNAGYINIVLKQNPDLGLNGSYSFSGGIGNGTTTSDNLSFNYRKNRINLFGNYSFLRQEQGQAFSFSRRYFDQNDIETDLATVSERDPTQRNHNLRVGLDFQTTEKTVFGLLLGAYDNKWTMSAINDSQEAQEGSPTSFVELITTERNQWQNFSSNVNFKHNFTDGEFISLDLDYLHYYTENPTDYLNTFFDGNNSFIREELASSTKTNPIDIIVGKGDYSNKINDDLKLEVGFKIVKSEFENDVVVANSDGSGFVEDPTLTNLSNLNENIWAVYASSDYQITPKTSAKLGFRYEHTDSELDTETQGRVVDRNFGKLFPSVFISYTANDTLSFNLAYSKRINRPTFNELAPFIIFVDPTTFISGNPALQPSISNSFTLSVNYKSIFLSLQHTIEDETISRFQERFDADSGRLFIEARNLDQTTLSSVTLGLPITITNWWKMQNNLIYLRSKTDAILSGDSFSFSQNSFRGNSSQAFTLPKEFSLEISGNYFGPRLQGVRKVSGTYFMNFGMQKKIGDNGGTLRFAVNDIFNSFKLISSSDIPEQNLNTFNTLDFSNRTFILTYSRNFGNNKLKSSRKRSTGSDEERKRVN